MFKNIFKTLLLIILLFSSFLTLAQDDSAPILGGIQNTLNDIDIALKDFSKRFLDFNALTAPADQSQPYTGPKLDPAELSKIKEPARSMIIAMQYTNPPNNFNTILQPSIDTSAGTTTIFTNDPSTQTLSLNALQSIFTTLDSCPIIIPNCILRTNVIAGITKLGITTPYDANGYISPVSYTTASTTINPNNKSLDVNSLLGPVAFTPLQQSQENNTSQNSPDTQYALNFIQLITEQYLPIQLKSALTGNPATDPTAATYLARLNDYASHQSIDLSNYYQMLARRIISSTDNKSQLQREQEMISRRLSGSSNTSCQGLSPSDLANDWHCQMENAPPAVIQREILYVLAEINYQLYLSRIEQERLLATVTAQHALTLQSTVKTGFLQPAGITQSQPMMPITPPGR